MRNFAVIVVALFSMSVLSQAQSSSSADKWQVYAGYSFSRDYGMINPYSLNSNGNGDEFAPYNRNGVQAELSYFLTSHLGLTSEVAFFTTFRRSFPAAAPHETFLIYTERYLIGPAFRYTLHGGNSRTTLFAHQLFGSSRNRLSDNLYTQDRFTLYSTTLVAGGGVDFRLARHLSLRPAELEYQVELLNSKPFYGAMDAESAKFGVDGLNYSGGAVFDF